MNFLLFSLFSDPSPFTKTLDMELYKEIANVAIFLSSKYNYMHKEKNEQAQKLVEDFYHKYKRNFHINKNTRKMKYTLKECNDQLETFPDGSLEFMVCLYDWKTKKNWN